MTGAASVGVRIAAGYRTRPGLRYGAPAGRPLTLDLHVPKEKPGPAPLFVLFHGGGWVTGSKEAVALHLLPWMERGWATAGVEYRLAGEAPAPAAAWDARAAVRWLVDHAAEHEVDRERVVLGGLSSGGHLALLTGLGAKLPPPAKGGPPDVAPVRAAAVVSFFGISDVAALLEGPRPRAYARRWMGVADHPRELARALSPLHHIDGHVPPVMSVHGDADPTVPYEQSRRLHERLDAVGVPNSLVTIEGAGHGDFGMEQWERAYGKVFRFLDEHVRQAPRLIAT